MEEFVKIAIGKPSEAGASWTPFVTDFRSPQEIRADIHHRLTLESKEDPDRESWLVTTNRTVLDLVRHEGAIGYEDVFIWSQGRLVPLLEIHAADWLTHFALGDLYDSLALEVPAVPAREGAS
jgi:hypothetical protein